MTAALEAYRPIFMGVTFAFLGVAFYFAYRPRSGARSRMMVVNKVMVWCVTVVAAVFLFFPQYFSGLAVAEGDFTAGMKRTVLSVEGMTCPG